MPDIQMCQDSMCPSRDRCYRYRAYPTPYAQSYGEYRHGSWGACSEFWDCTDYVKKNLRDVKEADDENWQMDVL